MITRLAAAAPRYRKFLVALAGALAQVVLLLQQLVASGFLHGNALAAVQVVLAALTAFGVQRVSNTDVDLGFAEQLLLREAEDAPAADGQVDDAGERLIRDHAAQHASPED